MFGLVCYIRQKKKLLTGPNPEAFEVIHFIGQILYASFLKKKKSTHQFHCCSVTELCPILCNSTYCSTPEFPVLPYLPEFAQIHVLWVGDAIQPLTISSYSALFSSHLQSFPESRSFPISQLFESGGQSIGA